MNPSPTVALLGLSLVSSLPFLSWEECILFASELYVSGMLGPMDLFHMNTSAVHLTSP